MEPEHLGDDLGLELVAAGEQPPCEGVRWQRLARLKRVLLDTDGALLGVAALERDLADVEARRHLLIVPDTGKWLAQPGLAVQAASQTRRGHIASELARPLSPPHVVRRLSP